MVRVRLIAFFIAIVGFALHAIANADSGKAVGVSPAASQSRTIISTEPQSAEPVFAASFKDFDRGQQALSQWKGKVLVVNFWATWCKPCRTEIPDLIAFYEKYKARNLMIVGVSIDNTDKVAEFAKEFKINYPLLLGSSDAIDLSKKMGNKVGGLPFTIIIDKKGNVAATVLGEMPRGKLEEVLIPLLS
jgi:thiol-disulfide isomerase/thioredoxin